MLGDVGVKAGGHHEGSAGVDGAVSLVNGQHSAGAQQHIGHLLVDQLDALLSAGGAEGNLSGRQAAVRQSLAQGQGLIYTIESDNGDNTNFIDFLRNGIHNAFSFTFRRCAVCPNLRA